MSWRRASSAKAAISVGGIVTPVGLPGVISTIARVRGVTSASASAARGIRRASDSRYTGRTPCIRSHMSWLK